jgi:glucokinase
MYIGIDIGGTHIRVAKGKDGKISHISDYPTKTFVENKKDILLSISKLSRKDIKGVGVSAPGPIGYRDSKIIEPNKFTGWTNIDLAKELKESLHLPVKVAHDAGVAALAEYTYGSQKGTDPFLYVTVSTGIGVGVIEDGKLLHGLYYPHAGHIYTGSKGLKDWCGQKSDLEGTASGWALKARTKKHPSETEGTTVWAENMNTLSIGLANFIMCYSPAVVVIGGGMTKNKSAFFDPLVFGVKKYLKIFPVPPIFPASLKEPGLVGAIELAQSII